MRTEEPVYRTGRLVPCACEQACDATVHASRGNFYTMRTCVGPSQASLLVELAAVDGTLGQARCQRIRLCTVPARSTMTISRSKEAPQARRSLRSK